MNLGLALFVGLLSHSVPDSIPLPEHPRPDFQRAEWLNLNGRWQFWFGHDGGKREIVVPFSWGSPLSGVPDSGDIGSYARDITVPDAWRGRRVFLVFGASDWRTTAWLDGQKLGEHQGGYTPFSFELKHTRLGARQRLLVRVDDTPHPFKLEGKQGYGKARGMWQTVYLEARGSDPLEFVHFTPRADLARVSVDVQLLDPAPHARAPNRAERAPGAREDRGAPQALLGRPPGRAHHGRRAKLVGSARFRGVPRARHCAARHDRTRLQPSGSVQLGAVQ